MPDFECPINPEWFGSNPFGLIGPQFITLQIVERAPFSLRSIGCIVVKYSMRLFNVFNFLWPDVTSRSFKVMRNENVYLSDCEYN